MRLYPESQNTCWGKSLVSTVVYLVTDLLLRSCRARAAPLNPQVRDEGEQQGPMRAVEVRSRCPTSGTPETQPVAHRFQFLGLALPMCTLRMNTSLGVERY